MSNPSDPDFPIGSFPAWDQLRFRSAGNSVEHDGVLYVIEKPNLETCIDQKGRRWRELKIPLRKYTAHVPIGVCDAFQKVCHEGIGSVVLVDGELYEIQSAELGLKNNTDGSSWFGMTVKISPAAAK